MFKKACLRKDQIIKIIRSSNFSAKKILYRQLVWPVVRLFKDSYVNHSRCSVKVKSAFILNVKHQISSI